MSRNLHRKVLVRDLVLTHFNQEEASKSSSTSCRQQSEESCVVSLYIHGHVLVMDSTRHCLGLRRVGTKMEK